MGSFRRRMTRRGNAIGVWVHHAAKGRFDGGGNAHVLMVTSPGRRTGVPRSTMVRYLEHDGGYLVWGSASGARSDPDWFRNLRHAHRAEVEIGTTRRTVTAQELDGAERDRVWHEVVLPAAPGVARYEAKAGRIIPVALLRPVDEA